MMPSKVKCAECGFLSVVLTSSREMACAEKSLRETGFLHSKGAYYIYDQCPLCAKKVVDFEAMIGPDASQQQRLGAVQEDRPCQEFVTWQPALSLKDHVEMKLLQEVERRTRDWREEDRADGRTTRQIAIVSAIVSGMIGLAGLIVAVLALSAKH